MKAPALFAAILVAAGVSAAELKDPLEVARDWNRTVIEARDVPAGSLTLTPGTPASKPLTIASGAPFVFKRNAP